MSTEARDCLAVARGAAQALGRDEIGSIDLLLGLLADATGAVPAVLAEFGIPGDAVRRCAGISAEGYRPRRLGLEAGHEVSPHRPRRLGRLGQVVFSTAPRRRPTAGNTPRSNRGISCSRW